MNYLILLAFACATTALAATYHLDPASGRLENDGSPEKPWPALEQVIKAGLIQARDTSGELFHPAGPIRAGDRLRLRDGYHGNILLNGYHFPTSLVVEAEAGQHPRLARVMLRGGSHWVFSGLDISPAYAPTTDKATIFAVLAHDKYGPASWISVEHCRISSNPTGAVWTTTNEWLEQACDGITLDGDHCRAVSNTVRLVAWGIQLGGVSNYAGYNLIEHFRGDGLRTMNHYEVAEYNTIRNAYLVDENHMDGIQGFFRRKPGREVRGVVIRGNVITRHENREAPLVSPYLQGIGFFDGPFVDCIFENNTVTADSHNGLSVYNAIRCRIIGNTIQGDPGQTAADQARIVLGCKSAYGTEVRDNQIISNRCDRLIVAPEATNTLIEGNTVGVHSR